MKSEFAKIVLKCIAVPVIAVPLCGATRSFRIQTDVSKAPENLVFAEKAKAICEEWYPRINEILFGSDRPLPFEDITIVFGEVKVAVATRTFTSNQTHRCVIGIPRDQGKKDGFEGTIIHELTHVVQNTPRKLPHSADWIEEGIGDYIRDKYYEKNITDKLPVKGMVGKLIAYTPGTAKPIPIEKKGYRVGYGPASQFLFWLEQTKDPTIVSQLCAAMSANKYSPSIFKRCCGAPLDDLWRQFVYWSRQ